MKDEIKEIIKNKKITNFNYDIYEKQLLDYITNLQERNNNQETMLRKIFGICYGNYSYNKKVEIIRAI